MEKNGNKKTELKLEKKLIEYRINIRKLMQTRRLKVGKSLLFLGMIV